MGEATPIRAASDVYSRRVLSLAALGSSLVWGFSDFAAGVVAKRHPAAAVVAWTQGLALVAVTLVVVLVPGVAFSWGVWLPWSVAAGLVGATGLSCYFAALSSGTMGVVAPIAGLGVAIPVLLGLLTGERLTVLTWVGIGVAVVGVTLASGPELRAGLSVRPVLLAAVAAVLLGLTFFCLDRAARDSLVLGLWGMRATSTTMFLLLALALRSVGGVRARELPWLFVIGCGDLAANALFALASSRGQVSVASVLASLYPVVTVVLARVVLDERLQRVQQAGVVLAGLGAVLIAT